jgi:hypothetical protein
MPTRSMSGLAIGKFVSLATISRCTMEFVLHCITVWFQDLAGWCPMLQIDPWVKAAECERVILVVADPERRSVFISLRSFWIALGNKETNFDESRQTGQVPMIAQIHAELMSLYKDAMN